MSRGLRAKVCKAKPRISSPVAVPCPQPMHRRQGWRGGENLRDVFGFRLRDASAANHKGNIPGDCIATHEGVGHNVSYPTANYDTSRR
jgi:hypothetical protein